jgi:cell division protein FtsL
MKRLRRIYRDLTNTEKVLLLTIGVFIAVIVIGNIFIL